MIRIAICLALTLPFSVVAKIDFNRQIRPILSDKCYQCHGPDANKRRADLRLDTKEGAFAADGDHRIITPGKPSESQLFLRITHENPRKRMPPRKSKLNLSPKEIALIKQWIEEGATWEQHWSLTPIRKVQIPSVQNQSKPRRPIDHFILSRLEREKIQPSNEASLTRLARRLSFDLIGLPPTVDDLDRLEQEAKVNRDLAIERWVDRLLASPRFGERWATPWLDASRYADTYGYQSDVYRAVWPWRDQIIRQLNRNVPFDQFATWQLAGDLLKNPTREQILATAFNRLHRQTNEGGSIEEEWRKEYVADRVSTFGYVFLGLTLECARCHDHKFDPISQKEFYQLAGFFNSIDESGLYSHFTNATPTPTLLLPNASQETNLKNVQARLAQEEKKLSDIVLSQNASFEAWLKKLPKTHTIPNLIGHFPLDAIQRGKLTNLADAKKPGRAVDGPKLVQGKHEKGIHLSGEDSLRFSQGGNFTRNDRFTIALWMQTPDVKERAVVFHRSRAWTDAGSRGYQLLIENGRLSASLIHFWPGNAIRIRMKEQLPIKTWHHVAMTYDGSSRASGLRLFVNGRRADCEIVRDNLYKNITGGGGNELNIGQRFRDRGFKNGLVDEVRIYTADLTAIEIAQIYQGHVDLSSRSKKELREHYFARFDQAVAKQRGVIHALRLQRSRAIDSLPEIMIMKEMASPRPTFLLKRGAYDAPTERVERATPTSVLPFAKEYPRNRLGLAQWLFDERNPLTARVAVNRIWQALFGQGLVATSEDFGSQGQPPTHPKLLDWLAKRFMNSGWNVKAIIREIVLSQTYRQSSLTSPALRKRDPENLLLARGPRYRLSAEMLRDNALSVSGLLSSRIGGSPVKPYQPDGLWREKSGKTYRREAGENSHRRSLYTYWKRTSPPPAMITLDAARRNVCVVKREATSTPLQPLVLMNDPQFVEAARALAVRAMSRFQSLDARIQFAFRSLTSRRASQREMQILRQLYQEQKIEMTAHPAEAKKLLSIGDDRSGSQLEPTSLAAFTMLTKTLMSFDETVMKR